MPELPEVETVVRDLNSKIKNHMIVNFQSAWPSAIKNATLDQFRKGIKNKKILKARRIGKNIFIDLEGGKTIYVHLKMTGHLLIKEKTKSNITQAKKNHNYFNDRVNQYVRHIWHIQDKNKKQKDIEFSDLRKFAKIVLVDTDKINDLPEIKSLGVDVMSESFSWEHFLEILQKRKNRPIGTVLLEQNQMSGIGNIYRSEILFLVKIHPKRLVKSLSMAQKKAVFVTIRKVMEKAIKLRGTSDSDFRDTNGAPGQFQEFLKVYNREGEKCPRCRALVKREKVAQRSIYFCPQCQK